MKTSSPPPSHTAEPCPPQPEGRWFWRRLYTYLFTLIGWGTLGWIIARAPADQSAPLAFGVMRLMSLVLVVYLVAPSAQQIVAVVAGLRR